MNYANFEYGCTAIHFFEWGNQIEYLRDIDLGLSVTKTVNEATL